MIPAIETYSWKEAFGYAGEPDTYARDGHCIQPALPTGAYDLSPFTREDVAHIENLQEGENDGASWIIYGQLTDGRWFYLEAGCDYTGWDCRASGTTTIAQSKDACERFALTDDARKRFRITLQNSDQTTEKLSPSPAERRMIFERTQPLPPL